MIRSFVEGSEELFDVFRASQRALRVVLQSGASSFIGSFVEGTGSCIQSFAECSEELF